MIRARVKPRSMRWAVVVAVVLLASYLPASPVAAAQLPLQGFAHMLVDHERDQVFITGGVGSDTMYVTGYNGVLRDSVANLPSAAGMAMVDDTLFVARQNGAAIDVVDPTSLQKIGTLSLPFSTSGALAYAGGRLWTKAGACGSWGDLIGIDLKQRTFVRAGTYYCPLLKGTPMQPHLLFVGSMGLSPSGLVIYDASYPIPRYVESLEPAEVNSNLGDFAITSDARHVLTANGAPYYIPEYRVADGQPTGVNYPTGPYPQAVAVTDAEGGFVAGGLGSASESVLLYPEGSTTHSDSFAVPDLADHGLAFAPEASRLLAVSDPFGGPVSLSSLPGPSGSVSEISLTASRASVDGGSPVTLNVHLQDHASSANKTVTIYAIPFGGSRRAIASGPVDASGDLSASFTPRRSTTFVARWEGDADYIPSSSDPVQVLVRVRALCRLTNWYGTSNGYKLYRLSTGAFIVGEVVPNQAGRRLRFEVQKRRDGRWRRHEAASFRIPSSGEVAVRFLARRPGTFRIRTVFDVFDFARAQSEWRYFKLTASRTRSSLSSSNRTAASVRGTEGSVLLRS